MNITRKGRLLAAVIATALVMTPGGPSGATTPAPFGREALNLQPVSSLEQKAGGGPLLSKAVCISCGAAVLIGSGTMSIAAVIIALGSVGPEVAAACLYACVVGFDLDED
ncbi:MAG: hypothetical protein ABR543_01590 [Gemmatimonadaceae bacterium]